ncbi:unnamed protein product [Arctia plantaginis]|uniref:Uncharacterized protein n=1 Tax=Arctia plantaginis TaxID=874455 RepID=A0A8S1A0V0_ARCPL|nr:unnamed protein product [Arctia plantaginis]
MNDYALRKLKHAFISYDEHGCAICSHSNINLHIHIPVQQAFFVLQFRAPENNYLILIVDAPDASTNLVGKFTQSVRRIVQDVKDEGTSSGQTKEEVIETNERLRGVRVRLDENYDTAKKALVTLMERYSDSKTQRNVFTRYAMLKAMIKVRVI